MTDHGSSGATWAQITPAASLVWHAMVTLVALGVGYGVSVGTTQGHQAVVDDKLTSIQADLTTVKNQIALFPSDHAQLEIMIQDMAESKKRLTELERDDFELRARTGLAPTDQRIHNLPDRR